MSYVNVDTIVLGARAGGDIQGQVVMALIKQATTRIALIGSTDSKESAVCRAVLDGTYPTSWTRIVLGIMDIQGKLATHTDAECDAAVVSAWTYFVAARALA